MVPFQFSLVASIRGSHHESYTCFIIISLMHHIYSYHGSQVFLSCFVVILVMLYGYSCHASYLFLLCFIVPFVRTIMDRYQLQEMAKRSEEGKLNVVFDSLNFLGSTCWKINTKILDIMISIFNDKGDQNLEIIGPDFPPLPRIKAK